MASEKCRKQLVKHIDEAYAMVAERSADARLDDRKTEDPEIENELREHKLETERPRRPDAAEARWRTGTSPSSSREAGGIAGALMKRVPRQGPRRKGRPKTRATVTRRSTSRSRAISCWSGLHGRPGTRNR